MICDDLDSGSLDMPITQQDFATARHVMAKALSQDRGPGGLYFGYQSNIAMLLHDQHGMGIEEANRVAKKLILLLWEVAYPAEEDSEKCRHSG